MGKVPHNLDPSDPYAHRRSRATQKAYEFQGRRNTGDNDAKLRSSSVGAHGKQINSSGDGKKYGHSGPSVKAWFDYKSWGPGAGPTITAFEPGRRSNKNLKSHARVPGSKISGDKR